MEVRPAGAENFESLPDDDKKEQLLNAAREEMAIFATFLKEKFFVKNKKTTDCFARPGFFTFKLNDTLLSAIIVL